MVRVALATSRNVLASTAQFGRCMQKHTINILELPNLTSSELNGSTWGQVGRCLDVHGRSKNQPGGSDGPQHLLQAGGLAGCHGRPLLGLEVLDDELLQAHQSALSASHEAAWGVTGKLMPGNVSLSTP